MDMKRVLMTNLYFEKYTGSELHTLEIAKLFVKKGYEVVVAVFQKAYPLLEKSEEFSVVNCLQEELEETDYDIVFVQHYPVFDYLCSNYDLTYKKLLVSKLSVISELEYLPICTEDADLIVCVSQECANVVYKEIGYDPRVKIMKNCAGNEYFSAYSSRNNDTNLKKIAVISNHIPNELLELSDLLSEGIEIDYIGATQSPRLVDVGLLKKYDLIITIGRTVQHCFAMGTLVYVYDYFGGPGYINDANFEIAEKNNFSGRGFSKKTAIELKKDIEENYVKSLSYIGKLHEIAQKDYNYEKQFDQIYHELISTPQRQKKTYYKGIEKQRMQLYSKLVPYYAFQKNCYSQLYIDYGDGFCEENSMKWEVAENYEIKKRITLNKKIRSIRFDPCDVPAEIHVYKILVNGETKVSEKRNRYFNFDPQIHLELTETEQNIENLEIEILYKYKKISWENTIDFYEEKIKSMSVQSKSTSLRKKIHNSLLGFKR